jgi:hypothetical protein
MFSFSDGITTVPGNVFDISIIPVNDYPMVQTNSPLPVLEGGSAIVTPAYLLVTDPDNSASSLTFHIDAAPSNGTLKHLGTPLSVGEAFTQADINSGDISYEHSGNETTNCFS